MVSHVKTVAFLFFCMLVFSEDVLAIESSHTTPLSCDGINSQIISLCSGSRAQMCISQNWLIGNKKIKLKEEGFDVSDWACLPSNSGYKIILYSFNGGNCDTCERLEIWSSNGEKLTDWQSFNTEYRKQGFPKKEGEDFFGQFNKVDRGVKTLNEKQPGAME